MKDMFKLKSPALFVFIIAILMYCDGLGVSPKGFGHVFEWVYRDCAQLLADGPVSGIYGFPFPYYSWAGDTSLHYLSMPHIFILNLLTLSFVPYVLLSHLFDNIGPRINRLLMRVGASLIALHVTYTIFIIVLGMLSFVPNAAASNGTSASYFKLRPYTWVVRQLKTTCNMPSSIQPP